MKIFKQLNLLLIFYLFNFIFASISVVKAESFFGASLGYSFNQKLTNVKGNENANYPDPAGGEYDGTSNFYIPGTTYTNVKLEDVFKGGLRIGNYFNSYPSLGLQLTTNYSKPNIFRQNVTICDTKGYINDYFGTGNCITEDQLKINVKMYQIGLDILYRYQDLNFKNFTPYIGAGPTINIFKISGSGYSGIIPDLGEPGGDGPNIKQTSTNYGANLKLGAEYKFDNDLKDWGLAFEYNYDWTPVKVNDLRSAHNLKADYTAQSVNLVLMRHF